MRIRVDLLSSACYAGQNGWVLDPILSGSLGRDSDLVPKCSCISANPGGSRMPPSLFRSVTPVPCRDGTNMVQSVWP